MRRPWSVTRGIGHTSLFHSQRKRVVFIRYSHSALFFLAALLFAPLSFFPLQLFHITHFCTPVLFSLYPFHCTRALAVSRFFYLVLLNNNTPIRLLTASPLQHVQGAHFVQSASSVPIQLQRPLIAEFSTRRFH